MRKILVCLLGITSVSAFAINNVDFQQFDNEYNIGYGMNQMTLQNGSGNQIKQSSQYMSLGIERLFDVGVWMNIDANLVLSQSQDSTAIGTGNGSSSIPGQPGMPATQDPNFGGVNAKVGYAFLILPEHLQITPYGMVGRNTNLAMSTILGNGYANVTNDFYYTGGIGARIEYRFNPYVFVYGDQLISYSLDQSSPTQSGFPPQNVMNYVTTIGVKYNLLQNLQIGLNGFYNNYQQMSATPTATPSINGGQDSNGNLTTIYQPQAVVGGVFTVGLTY